MSRKAAKNLNPLERRTNCLRTEPSPKKKPALLAPGFWETLLEFVAAGRLLLCYWSATSILVFVLFVDPISMTTAFVGEMT
jgi:hypothetical protein